MTVERNIALDVNRTRRRDMPQIKVVSPCLTELCFASSIQ